MTTIGLKLKPSDKNRLFEVEFDYETYKFKTDNRDYLIADIQYGEEELFDVLSEANFSYDEVLYLILHGNQSYIEEWYVDQGEDWDDNKPMQTNRKYYIDFLFENNKWVKN